MKEAATVEEDREAAAERRAAAAEAAAAHLLDEPAPLVRAVAEAGVVVSPGRLLRIKTRRLLLLLLAHRAALMGRAATKWARRLPDDSPRDPEGETCNQSCRKALKWEEQRPPGALHPSV